MKRKTINIDLMANKKDVRQHSISFNISHRIACMNELSTVR